MEQGLKNLKSLSSAHKRNTSNGSTRISASGSDDYEPYGSSNDEFEQHHDDSGLGLGLVSDGSSGLIPPKSTSGGNRRISHNILPLPASAPTMHVHQLLSHGPDHSHMYRSYTNGSH